MKYCYYNGRIIPENQAKISLEDIGILRGYGLFETLRTYYGRPFLVSEHFQRLQKGADFLNIHLPFKEKDITPILLELLQKNHYKEAVFRLIITGGKIKNNLAFDSRKPTSYILARKITHYPPSYYQKGIKLITHSYQRRHSAIKTTDYLEAVLLQRKLKQKNSFEPLYVHDGYILECATSNFFLFQGNNLLTPKNHILKGITRNFVLQLAQPYFNPLERDIKIEEIAKATECFITATNKEIMPVTQIDNHQIGTGKPGPNTRFLIKKFHETISRLFSI
jgi:branched-chain amino acid aminotransferase